MHRLAYARPLAVALSVLLALCAACASAPPAPPVEPLTIEARLELPQGGEAFPYEGAELRLGPPRTFRVARAYAAQDLLGYPAIGLEIADEELDAWGDWTAAHRGESLAVLVAGEVVTLATLRSRVGKHLTLEGRPRGYSDEEYARLARALRVE